MDSSLHMHIASLKIQDEIRRASSARLAKQAMRHDRRAPRALARVASGDPSVAPARLPNPKVIVTTLKTGASPWLMTAMLLLALGLLATDGTAASIILACGFLALFGAAIRVISRNDPTGPAERRIPAGHSGV